MFLLSTSGRHACDMFEASSLGVVDNDLKGGQKELQISGQKKGSSLSFSARPRKRAKWALSNALEQGWGNSRLRGLVFWRFYMWP